MSEASVDSLYKAPDIRVLQHILFGAGPSPTPARRRPSSKKAEAALARIRKGASFEQARLAAVGGSGQQGRQRLPAAEPRGRFVPAFDSAPWALAPGQVTGLVETPFGFHIIKRPGPGRGRDRLVRLSPGAGRGVRLDSLYMDSLATAHKIEVLPSAPAAMPAAAGRRRTRAGSRTRRS